MTRITLTLLLAAVFGSCTALADNHTFSLGYAQSKVQDFKSIHGANLQYRFEIDTPVSLLASFTWMKGNENEAEYFNNNSVSSHIDVKYYSLLAGPAYRINDTVSLYAIGGVAQTKASISYDYANYGNAYISEKSTDFAWGAGVIVNPVTNLSITAGYEGTRASLGDRFNINGFNVGVGYRF